MKTSKKNLLERKFHDAAKNYIHAFVIADENGLELLVHIGLDTVELKGSGFDILKNEGEIVKAGDPIVKADLEFISSQRKDIITGKIFKQHVFIFKNQ